MIDYDILLAFILTSAVVESTPGPNMAYLAILSASDGRRAGFAAVAGVALGLLIVGLAAAFGVAAIIAGSPAAYQILRFGGIAYLLWLAWDGWRGEEESSDHDSLRARARFFRRGLITNLLNPKAAVFYVAILPEFIAAGKDALLSQAITLTIVYVIVATLIHSMIVAGAGTARDFLQDDRKRLILRRTLSVALAGIAIWFGWSTRAGL